MSRTFSIGCEACKKHLWIGQGSYIYGDLAHNKALATFLHEHRGPAHPLVFDEDAEALTFEGSTEMPGATSLLSVEELQLAINELARKGV